MYTDKEKIWTDRYTVRKFSEDSREIKSQDLQYIKNIFKHIPTQCGTKSVIWLYLSDQGKDLEFRKWLIDNVYSAELNFEGKTIREYFLPVYQSPGLFLAINSNITFIDMKDKNDYVGYQNREYEKIEYDYSRISMRNEGIYTGVLLSELLHLNYSVGTFGCTNYFGKDKENKTKYFTNYLKENYENELKSIVNYQSNDVYDNIVFIPGTTITFGPKGEYSSTYKLEHYENYDYVMGRKAPEHRKVSNIIIK